MVAEGSFCPRLLILGHSHTNCVAQALKAKFASAVEWRHLQIKQWQNRARRKDRSLSRDQLDELLVNEIARIITRLGDRPGRLPPSRIPGFVKSRGIATILCLRGAQHIIKGLIEADPPYDFVLPEEEHLPIQDGAIIVPFNAIQEKYQIVLSSTMTQLNSLHKLIRHNLFHVEIPPPYGDNDFIRRQIGGYFDREYPDGITVASPILRYKIWRVSTDIYRKYCEKIGVTYLSVPAETVIDGRFLHPDGYYNDAVHANEWYGGQVIQQLLPMLPPQAMKSTSNVQLT